MFLQPLNLERENSEPFDLKVIKTAVPFQQNNPFRTSFLDEISGLTLHNLTVETIGLEIAMLILSAFLGDEGPGDQAKVIVGVLDDIG